MAALVAKRYATALFQAVQESETADAAAVLQELKGIQQALDEVPAFARFFTSPVVGDREKKQFITELFKDKISTELYHFLMILVDKRREGAFEGMVQIFGELTEALENRMEAVAVTAVPMNEASRASMAASLSTLTGREVTLTNQVDTSIIGGVMVRMGDRVIDGTVRNRLNLLKEDLTQMIV